MIDVESYCRDIEAYLCRKNDGHLIPVTGAAFEQVTGWANQGVPIKIAEAGIDRYFERYYRKGPRRRPVRIEFCEADVLDAFDEWRRAVGVTRVVSDPSGRSDALFASDIIYAVNDTPVSSFEDLRKTLQPAKTGESVVLQVERLGQLQFLVVEVQ